MGKTYKDNKTAKPNKTQLKYKNTKKKLKEEAE